MIKKATLLYLGVLLCVSPFVYGDGILVENIPFASGLTEQIPYDTEFSLPVGRFFSAPVCLVCPELKTGDEIYVVVHDMREHHNYFMSSIPVVDRFTIWTDSKNISDLSDGYDPGYAAAVSTFGLPEMYRTAPVFPVYLKQLRESGSRTAQSFDMLASGPEYDYGEGPDDYIIGEKQTLFWVHEDVTNPFGMMQIAATLRAIGQNTTPGDGPDGEQGAYAYIFVENQEWDNGHVDIDVVQEIADAFNGDTGLYAAMTNLLGYEWGGGPAGDGGIDGNKNVYILLHDVQDGFDSAGGYVAGYYYSVHDIGTTLLYTLLGIHSNEKQMVVLDTWPTITFGDEKNSAGSISVLIHEFQHMIHFNRKTGRDGAWADDFPLIAETWLNEACSMLCEDIFKAYINDPEFYVYNERMPEYLLNPSWPLDYWPGISRMEDALNSYSTAYSFLAYLARNVSPMILTEMITGQGSDTVGLESVAIAVKALGESDDIGTLIKRWRESIIHNDATTPWLGYPGIEDNGYELSELNLADILAESVYRRTTPSFSAIPETAEVQNIETGYNTMIFAGKVTSDGDVRIYLKNGLGISHLEYKVIRK